MTFNSIILVRGIQKPIIVSRTSAEKVRDMLGDRAVEDSQLIRIDRFAFRKGDVKSVEIVADENNRKIEEDRNEFYAEEKRNYTRISALSPESKAKMFQFFDMLFQCIAAEEATDEVHQALYEIQLDFFKKNPRRTLCDFQTLAPLLLKEPAKFTVYRDGGMRLAEAAIFRDMQLAGHFDKKTCQPPKTASDEKTIKIINKK